MTLANDLLEGMESIYEYAGVDAVHTTIDGKTTEVKAIVDYELQQYGTIADVSGKTAAISVRFCELESMPRRTETFQIGSVIYTVDRVVRADELEHVSLVV